MDVGRKSKGLKIAAIATIAALIAFLALAAAIGSFMLRNSEPEAPAEKAQAH